MKILKSVNCSCEPFGTITYTLFTYGAQYAIAIETPLHSAMECNITNSEKDALALFELLRKNLCLPKHLPDVICDYYTEKERMLA